MLVVTAIAWPLRLNVSDGRNQGATRCGFFVCGQRLCLGLVTSLLVLVPGSLASFACVPARSTSYLLSATLDETILPAHAAFDGISGGVRTVVVKVRQHQKLGRQLARRAALPALPVVIVRALPREHDSCSSS